MSIPVVSLDKYSSNVLSVIYKYNEGTTLTAFVCVIFVFIIYIYQGCTRFHSFDPDIKPIHILAITSLLLSFLYLVLLFMLSTNLYKDIPFINTCKNISKLYLITFNLIKYFVAWNIIFNLSYMNQSPWFNPRYKYITKFRRKNIRMFFICLKWLIGVLLMISLYTSFTHNADYKLIYVNNDPSLHEYCTIDFTLWNFFKVYGGDIITIIGYSLLFGRNAFSCTRRQMRIDTHNGQHLLEFNIDDDDPLYHSANKSKSNINRSIDHENSSYARTNNSISSISREQYLINGMHDGDGISTIEDNGVMELVRVLRLIWFMFGFYWLNILLYIFTGLFIITSNIWVIGYSICILLLNDYDFGDKYWDIKSFIGYNICCCCNKSMFGKRKNTRLFMDSMSKSRTSITTSNDQNIKNDHVLVNES